ncbi:MAG: DUF4199 domain-containing protein [Cyclobacteriaceae bacterium]|jgi:hypothetical protein|nr:DUF4199 domain-containing protein [Cyclobacteriaceae bacterium]
MKKPSALVLIGVRYGALAAILSVSLMVVMYYLDRHPLMVAPFLDFRVALYGIFIFFALREYRDFHQEGNLYFWQGIVGSFFLVVTAAVIGSLLLRGFCSWESNFIPDYVTAMTEYLKGFPEEDINRIGKETYERNLAVLPATNCAQISGTYIVQSMAIGLFVSIILSVILRKETKSN